MPLRHSAMPRVLNRSHRFTCTPHFHPLMEWITIPAFLFQPKLVLIYRPWKGGRLSLLIRVVLHQRMLQTWGYCVVWCICLLPNFRWYSLPYPQSLAWQIWHRMAGHVLKWVSLPTHSYNLLLTGPTVEQWHWIRQCYHWAVVDGVTCDTACVSCYSRRIYWSMSILRDQSRCWSSLTSVMPVTSTMTRTSIDWWAMQSLLHRSWSPAALPVCCPTFGLHHFQIHFEVSLSIDFLYWLLIPAVCSLHAEGVYIFTQMAART